MGIIVQTPRIIVRQFLPGEEELYLQHFNDDLVTEHLPKRSKEERRAIFRNALVQYASGEHLGLWGIFDKSGGDFIGSCLLRLFGAEPGIVELGYSMERKYWGKGLGTEMGTAMVAYGFEAIDTAKIVAVTTLENIASQRVLQKTGLKQMDNIFKDGLELAYFGIERINYNYLS